MALSADIKISRYGIVDAHSPLVKGITASATVYRGSAATTRSGYLVAATSPQSTDVVWGLIANGGPGVADTGAGVVGGGSNGAVSAEIATGTFLLAAGTGADALTVTNEGASVYLINESSVGATTGGGTRPVAGVLIATPTSDPTIPTGFVAVVMGSQPTAGAVT